MFHSGHYNVYMGRYIDRYSTRSFYYRIRETCTWCVSNHWKSVLRLWYALKSESAKPKFVTMLENTFALLIRQSRKMLFWRIFTVRIINKKTLMQSIKYATKIVFIWVWFYWRSFEEQQAHRPHLLTWVNNNKSLSMHFSLLVVMFVPNYPFGYHINQSIAAFLTKCVYSVADYASNISQIPSSCNFLGWLLVITHG